MTTEEKPLNKKVDKFQHKGRKYEVDLMEDVKPSESDERYFHIFDVTDNPKGEFVLEFEGQEQTSWRAKQELKQFLEQKGNG